MSGINDFVVKFATVNGSGSASANGIFAKTLFRMGIPVAPGEITRLRHPHLVPGREALNVGGEDVLWTDGYAHAE